MAGYARYTDEGPNPMPPKRTWFSNIEAMDAAAREQIAEKNKALYFGALYLIFFTTEMIAAGYFPLWSPAIPFFLWLICERRLELEPEKIESNFKQMKKLLEEFERGFSPPSSTN